MAYKNLQEFIADLDRGGELKRIGVAVDPYLEVTEIADRAMKSRDGGPALLLENVKGSRIPLGINLFGSRRRISMALGVDDLDEIGDRLATMLKLEVPDSLMGKLALLPMLKEMTGFPPRQVRSGPCQEQVLRGEEVDLGRLPVTTCWPLDGGPFITMPLVITRDPETGVRNVGMYRMQVLNRNTTAMHWQRHKVGARHYDLAKRRGKRLEVAAALGGDPATIYSATAPIPPAIDEFIFTGFLRRSPMGLVRGVTVDLEVPAEAEIVLEGYVDPTEDLVREGPFGDHTGFLLSCGRLSGFPRHRDDDASKSDLPDDDRRQASHGRLLDGTRHRADLSALDEVDASGDRGLSHAGRGHLPQPRVRFD